MARATAAATSAATPEAKPPKCVDVRFCSAGPSAAVVSCGFKTKTSNVGPLNFVAFLYGSYTFDDIGRFRVTTWWLVMRIQLLVGFGVFCGGAVPDRIRERLEASSTCRPGIEVLEDETNEVLIGSIGRSATHAACHSKQRAFARPL